MTAAARRWIAHLDMDAFYASVELLRYPQLRECPVVIGGSSAPAPRRLSDGRWHTALLKDYVGRGVITTANYPARKLGVHSAMGLMKAAKLAPDALLLPADFDQYRVYSRRFKAAVAEIAPHIEDRGIDEIYIDLSQVAGAQDALAHDPYGGVRALALEIKNNVHQATGLTCSIGVTPCKLLSKIASELDKPDGLTVLTHEDLAQRVWPLPVGRINGIGPKAAATLAQLGVHSIGELAACEPQWLRSHFGASYAAWLYRAARGQDDSPVNTHSEPVSMSRETTFDRDLHAVHDRAQLSAIVNELCQQLAADLQRKRYGGRTIGIKLRFADFSTVTRDVTIAAPTADARVIRQQVSQCLKRAPLVQRIRLLGVRVASLTRVA